MFRTMIHQSGPSCLRIVHDVLNRVRPDQRLAPVVVLLEEALRIVEEKNDAHVQSVAQVGVETGNREATRLALRDVIREFSLVVLSGTRNNFHVDPFLGYFPDGYGKALRLPPAKLCQFAQVVNDRLAGESDPKLAAFRDRIAAAREALLAADAARAAAVVEKQNTFEHLEATKRDFVDGMTRARLQTESIYVHERRYVRSLFASTIRSRRRAGTDEDPGETDGNEGIPPSGEIPESVGQVGS